MSEIFTKRLAITQALGPGPATVTIEFPATGAVNSVLYMSATWDPASEGDIGQGFTVLDENGLVVWKVHHPYFNSQRSFEWHGREVVPAGVNWDLVAKSVPLTLRVAGFNFTS